MNSADVLNTNLGSDLDKSQLNNIKNYLCEDNDRRAENDQRLIDTVGVLKNEIMKTNASQQQTLVETLTAAADAQQERQQIQMDAVVAKLLEQEERINLQQREFNKRERELQQQQEQQQQLTTISDVVTLEISAVEDLSHLVRQSLASSSTVVDIAADNLSTVNYAASTQTTAFQGSDLSTINYNT